MIIREKKWTNIFSIDLKIGLKEGFVLFKFFHTVKYDKCENLQKEWNFLKNLHIKLKNIEWWKIMDEMTFVVQETLYSRTKTRC